MSYRRGHSARVPVTSSKLPGIGEIIADIVAKLHKIGTHPLLEKLRRDVPDGVLDMLSVPGLKPEKSTSSIRSLVSPTSLRSRPRRARTG
jgi:DNA polymerase/3'-5' exonuclease PolX